MTYPLILKMRTEAIGAGGGDGTYFIWLVAWYQKALFQLKISPFFAPYLNYPQGWNLATTDITPAQVALALPGSLLVSPTFGYNFAMLLSFILSGWGMYLWVRHLTGDSLAGLVAGTVFAFLPFRMVHFVVGHLSLAGTQWFPFYFWGLFDLLKQEKFSWKPVLMAGISAGLIGLTSPYYVYMTGIISGAFLLGFIIFRGYKRLKYAAFWKSLLAFGLMAALLVGLSMLPYLNLNSQNGLASRSADYLNRYSASPTDYVIPSIKQFLWGKWVDNTFSPEIFQESTLYIGAVAFVLALIAWIKRRQLRYPELADIAILAGAVAFVLSLGIQLHWLGKVVVSLPRFLQVIFHRTKMPTVYLPAYYLFRFLPFFSKMRVMMRFGLFTLIFSSMLAGLGAYLLTKASSPKTKRWVGILLLVLIFIDFYPGVLTGFSVTQARPVDSWLAAQPNTGAVAQFPFTEESDQGQVYNTLVYQKPFLGGYFNANSPEQYERIYGTMLAFPSQDSVDLLRQLGVTYVVVDSSSYAAFSNTDQEIQSLGLVRLYVSGNEYVYGLSK
ncbi:MAG TPA: hypothetical protein VMT91_08215 [Anaerolineales bacterium]|nr:hypothetical protein [Anaerolineales bacterium]